MNTESYLSKILTDEAVRFMKTMSLIDNAENSAISNGVHSEFVNARNSWRISACERLSMHVKHTKDLCDELSGNNELWNYCFVILYEQLLKCDEHAVMAELNYYSDYFDGQLDLNMNIQSASDKVMALVNNKYVAF